MSAPALSIKEQFDLANKAVHLVENQWHYAILTPFGYIPDDKEAVGFVRSYTYTHPHTGHSIQCNTGYQSDYWVDETTKQQGYWAALKPHLKLTTGQV